MSIYTEKITNGYDEVVSINCSKKGRKLQQGRTGHIPNKDEAQELRKIMASTGLKEEEVRADKKYRKMLSEAQKDGQKRKRDYVTKWYHLQIKKACRQTKLAPQHPETIKALQEIFNGANPRWYRMGLCFYSNHQIMPAEKAVKTYAK